MRGYIPPFLPLTRNRIFTGAWPDQASMGSHRISGFGIAVPNDISESLPVVGALATLLRWLNMSVGGKLWMSLDAGIIQTAVRDGLGGAGDLPPLSFATALYALGMVPQGDLPESMKEFASPTAGSERANHTGKWPWRLDMIVTTPRSRIMLKLAIAFRVPVAAGLSITEQWTDARDVATGLVRMPELGAQPIDGDCVVLDGWDDERGAFSCWFTGGQDWGSSGRGWIPYEYVCSPLWCHELVMIPPD